MATRVATAVRRRRCISSSLLILTLIVSTSSTEAVVSNQASSLPPPATPPPPSLAAPSCEPCTRAFVRGRGCYHIHDENVTTLAESLFPKDECASTADACLTAARHACLAELRLLTRQLEGYYEAHGHDCDGDKSDSHYVRIFAKSPSSSSALLWYDRAGQMWELFPTSDPAIYTVSADCPAHSNGYHQCRVGFDAHARGAWIEGPGGERFSRVSTVAGGRPHWEAVGERTCVKNPPLTRDQCTQLEGPFEAQSQVKCCEWDVAEGTCGYVGGTCPSDIPACRRTAVLLGRSGSSDTSAKNGKDKDDHGDTPGYLPATNMKQYLRQISHAVGGGMGKAQRIQLIFLAYFLTTLLTQVVVGLWCYQIGRLWASCGSPLRAMVCNPIVWWSREIWLDYECLNPCACDAHPDTLVPLPDCPMCDFPGRLPPSPASSWRAINTPFVDEGVPVNHARCSLLPSSPMWKPWCPGDALLEDEILPNGGDAPVPGPELEKAFPKKQVEE